MIRTSTLILAGAAAIALHGCTKKEEAKSINDAMTQIMEPNAEKVWNTVSRAYNDVGDALDPKKLSDIDWKEIREASAKMKARADEIATASQWTVAKPNELILGSQAVGEKGKIGTAWDPVGPNTIQSRIDAKPELFKEKARALVDAADGINRAAQNHDTVQLYKIASNLDEVCDSCHEPFWGTDEPPPPPKIGVPSVVAKE